MKCWVTKKTLPLYISEDDPAVLHYFVSRHLEECPSCRKTRRLHLDAHQSLQSVKNRFPLQNAAGDFWKDIEKRLEPSKAEQLMSKDRSWLSFATLAAATVICLFAIFPEISYDVFQNAAGSRFKFVDRQVDASFPNSAARTKSFFLREAIYESVPLGNSGNEKHRYELDEARPLETKKASF